ncbi:MAG: ABC transporter permease [Deltaproteobacteria bacterium]|nr:ABC transporter permease [Deltaproteobacteria bacterium]
MKRKRSRESYWRLVWRQFRKNRFAMAGFVLVLALCALAVLAPCIAGSVPLVAQWKGRWIVPVWRGLPEGWNVAEATHVVMPPIPYSPTEYDLQATLIPPSAAHWFGTDDQGRDVAARLVHGTKISLTIGFVAVGLAAAIGIVIGALAGYYGGWVDIIVSRAIEVMYCFPTFFLILAVLAFIQPSIYNIMIVIGVTGWPGIARLIRGEFFKLRDQEFVAASRVTGAGDLRVMFRHMLPNAIAPVLVSITFGIASAILVESGLSFLGFGVPPYEPSWGGILSQSRDFIDIAWWLTVVPGCAIFVTITAYNLVGEGLRDAIDPRMRE